MTKTVCHRFFLLHIEIQGLPVIPINVDFIISGLVLLIDV